MISHIIVTVTVIQSCDISKNIEGSRRIMLYSILALAKYSVSLPIQLLYLELSLIT